MDKFLNFVDVLPGYKTWIFALVSAIFNLTAVFGIWEPTADQASAINVLLNLLVVGALGLKANRAK